MACLQKWSPLANLYLLGTRFSLTIVNETMVWRSVTDKIFKLENEQYETHTYKTKIGHKISKQQKMNRTAQKLNRTGTKINRTVHK